MKKFKLILSMAFVLFYMNSFAQELTPQLKEYEKNKVQIFTVDERDNLSSWFNERAKEMNLSESQKDDYTNILISYLAKMGRLDDKDQYSSKKEVLKGLDKIIKKQDKEVKKILTAEQYKIHKDNYGRLLKSVRTRIEETDY